MACQVNKGRKAAGDIIRRLLKSTEAVLNDVKAGKYNKDIRKFQEATTAAGTVAVADDFEKVRLQPWPQLTPLANPPPLHHSLSPSGVQLRSRPVRPLGS